MVAFAYDYLSLTFPDVRFGLEILGIVLDVLMRKTVGLDGLRIISNCSVENLTGKSQILEAELERSSRKLKEVTAVAEGEAEKCKAAKEVIKSLTAQE
ncbi:hypothetical protein CK203_082878 [Vitis vinifera]|uniref:Transcription factor BREVIS RADIX N-terminal domain-containing protein n=1 Tax=Vitis vinifera TaxID=29760 RepID=A0A438D732_VITVI|nr:hypothetical protein CK203_082878 [Vitis vinifera]